MAATVIESQPHGLSQANLHNFDILYRQKMCNIALVPHFSVSAKSQLLSCTNETNVKAVVSQFSLHSSIPGNGPAQSMEAEGSS